MTFEQWERAIRSRVSSSYNLHKHLTDLSFFVLLSSLTGVVGHLSQSNYAAGNTFQDALARHRAAQGLPAVALDLSAVTSVGYVGAAAADADDHPRKRIEALGSRSLDIGTVLRLVEAAMLRCPRRARPDDAQVIVGLAPWEQLPDGAPVKHDRRFGTLRLASVRGAAVAAAGAAEASPTAVLVQGLKHGVAAEVVPLVTRAVGARLAQIFNVAPEEIDPNATLASHGVDSLVAVEVRNWLAGAAKAKMSIFEILHSKSLIQFAELVTTRSELVAGEVKP
jgi:hypothetical protein